MTFIVTEACIQCKYTDCVSVCPVDCFHEGPNFLVIDPKVCIDCAVCVPECPVGAIVADTDLAEDQKEFASLNAIFAEQWPVISAPKEPLPEAEKWASQINKRSHLIAAGEISLDT